MSISRPSRPFNQIGPRIKLSSSTAAASQSIGGTTAILFLLAAGATLMIWVDDPTPERIYEVSICGLAALLLGATARCKTLQVRLVGLPAMALLLIGIWGFGQLLASSTVYRWATLNTGLRMLGLAATGVVSWCALAPPRTRDVFLGASAWFGFLLSWISVLAYFTSVGKVLWFFPVKYPDIWGPFLSRNNFAQFLELAMPIALSVGLEREICGSSGRLYTVMAASMLAAGLSSASRAGALILMAESYATFWLAFRKAHLRTYLVPAKRALIHFVIAGVLFGVVAGSGAVWVRIKKADPLEYRREIYHSSLAMIRDHPLGGTGLGTFAEVYPAYASFDSGAVVKYAHSDWLEWAAEGGLAYVAIWGALLIWLLRPAIGSIWGLGVLGVFTHALVDYPFARLGVAAWVFILAGALVRFEQQSHSALREPARLRH